MSDKLVEIPFGDLPSLRDLYKIDWPKYNVGYGILDNYLRWLTRDPRLPHLKIYSLNGDWSDGTFVVVDWNFLFFNTLNESFSRLETALSLIDFSKRYIIASVEGRLIDKVKKFCEDRLPIYDTVSETKWVRLAQDDASKIVVDKPDNIMFQRLPEEDVCIANDLWPHKHPGSLKFLKRLAKYNINYGAYTTDGELVAWCFRLPVGGLGILQVTDSNKRKGYGSLMVKAFSKAVSETGYDIFAPIVVDNNPSLNMFEKMGFKEIDQMFWILPNVYGDWKDE